MGIIRILKPVVFFYECIRIVLLVFTLVLILPKTSAIPWLAFTAPGAIFPLMTLFLWIDYSRYKPYMPLYFAGKCIAIFSILGWSIVSRRFTMFKEMSGYYLIIDFLFLSGDLLAFAAALLIFKNMQKITVNTAQDMEEIQ
jgi:hypothetical protein